jgi:hypothetical protein
MAGDKYKKFSVLNNIRKNTEMLETVASGKTSPITHGRLSYNYFVKYDPQINYKIQSEQLTLLNPAPQSE